VLQDQGHAAIAAALRTDGFAVSVAVDLDHQGLITALRTFANEADNADWAVVYFAGHGIEIGGVNYLIPVDAKLATDGDVDLEATPIRQVMSAIDGARVLRLLIMDACRDNPFAVTMRRTGEARDVGRGRTSIVPARGTVVFYSAKDGTIAADGDGPDSPFAMALAKHLTDPGVEIDKVFRLVADDVLDATGNRQEPFVYGSLTAREDFYFRPHTPDALVSQASAAPTLMPSVATSVAPKADEWRRTPVAGGSLAVGGLDAPWAPWGVQIASSFSLDQALGSFAAIQHEFPGATLQPPLVMRNVDRNRCWAPLYQIRIRAADQKSAKAICSHLEAARAHAWSSGTEARVRQFSLWWASRATGTFVELGRSRSGRARFRCWPSTGRRHLRCSKLGAYCVKLELVVGIRHLRGPPTLCGTRRCRNSGTIEPTSSVKNAVGGDLGDRRLAKAEDEYPEQGTQKLRQPADE
jgi:hypothetical protein